MDNPSTSMIEDIRDDLSDMKSGGIWTALDVVSPKCMTSDDPHFDELKRFWVTVIEDPNNFSFWANLLQFVNERDDVEEAREAYFYFFRRFPLYHFYWKKFAEYELMTSKENSDEVYQLGFVDMKMSVNYWWDYIDYRLKFYQDEKSTRELFDMMVRTCGIHFKSDRLWERFIEWEKERGRTFRVIQIYDELLKIPTEKHSTHWHKFQEIINNEQISLDEFFKDLNDSGDFVGEILQQLPSELRKGPFPALDNMIQTEARKKLIAIRQDIHDQTEKEVNCRLQFEKQIKRPFFIIKPLPFSELEIWMNYLKYEIDRGDQQRIDTLFERGIIACSHHEVYWLFYSKYLKDLMLQLKHHPEQKAALEVRLRRIYRRGCTIHVPYSTSLLLKWCNFEERAGHYKGAHLVLDLLEKAAPEFDGLDLLRINLYRRQEDYDQVVACYRKYIETAEKDAGTLAPWALRASRFASKVMLDASLAEDFMEMAIEKEPQNAQLYLQLFDLHFQKQPLKWERRGREEEAACLKGCIQVLDRAMQSPLDVEDRCQFAKRKVEFMKEFGSSADDISQAQEEYTKLVLEMKVVIDTKKIDESSLGADFETGGAVSAPSGLSYSYDTASSAGYQGYNNPVYQYQTANGRVGQEGYYHPRHPNLHQNYPGYQYPTAGGWVNQQGYFYQQQQNPQQCYYPRNHY